MGRHRTQPQYVVDVETGCWVWQLRPDSSGYAQTWINGRRRLAHRVYFEQANGPIPAGMEIDHGCRNRLCVNPEHLEVVTHAENMRRSDCAKKLTAAIAGSIREAYAAGGVTHKQLAALHGISRATVSDIVNHRTWRSRRPLECSRPTGAGTERTQ